ncbi:hypothetical protein [Ekhidna sp.]
MIAEEYEERIIEEVNNSSIKSQILKDDLIDHFCCLVEIEMTKGLSFEKALEKAYVQTAPNGLEEIQKETIFLLNYSKIIIMKRVTYLSGYLFSLTWAAGALFKVLNLQGAGMLLGIGGLGIAFIFLPLLLVNRYRNFAREVMSEKMKYIFGIASIILLLTSITMKMLHLMGASLMLALSFLVFGFGFLPFLFFRMYKKSLDEL